MKRKKVTAAFEHVLKAAKSLARLASAKAIVLLADDVLDFREIKRLLRGSRVLIGAENPEVQAAVKEDGLDLVPLEHEPQTRSTQVSQLLLEAIADEHLQSGDVVVALYSTYEKDICDTISLIQLADQLAKLTSRDLQRLETQVPLETLRIVVDLACEIGREGREGKPVGTLFVVGNHRKVMALSQEQVHDPFRGYSRAERLIRSPRVRESMKELAQIDGAFVISADGVVQAAGRHLRASADEIVLSKGLGSRHWAAAEISKATDAIAIAVSESTGTVRVFQDGKVVLRIEPMDSNMKWTDFDTDPPASDPSRQAKPH
ncbi:MAG: diadenylate cyclase [Planctomycetaceae bacterium]|nr:diadenylate cyclase [Planctomycetaceae bacterium]